MCWRATERRDSNQNFNTISSNDHLILRYLGSVHFPAHPDANRVHIETEILVQKT